MKVSVVGLGHLGMVTAACLASGGHDVIAVEDDPSFVAGLLLGRLPAAEPGLEDLVQAGLANGRLHFTTDVSAVKSADVVWIAFDTPVDDDDRAGVEIVCERTTRLFPHLRPGSLLLISSQLPVGTTRRLEQRFARESNGRAVAFGCSPENLRLGKAIEAFTHPDRVVVGVRSETDRKTVAALFEPFTDRIEWMSVESAEMTKHAVNAFLATSIAFINEVAALCEQVGADARQVARGLKSDARIGAEAYLSPGAAFFGGALARDIVCLSGLGQTHAVTTHLLSSVKTSNDVHRHWAQDWLVRRLGCVANRSVAIWGLAHKPGTDRLSRPSAVVELCRWLHEHGATVRVHDPAVKCLPADVASYACLAATPMEAVTGASALVVATPWPEYRQVAPEAVTARMTRTIVLDANRLLASTFGADPAVEYISVGIASGT